MKRATVVHSAQERIAVRMAGERHARIALVQLLCAVSILRTLLTQVVPTAGSASWWIVPVCLLPGIAAALLLRLAMRMTGSDVLADCFRACFGRWTPWLTLPVLTLPLLLDGAASLTALVTMFTQGIGTRGTQWTLALLSCGVLLACLHREGLPRAALVLNRLLLAGAAVIVLCALPGLRADGLHPVFGEGEAALIAALRQGMSLAWPVALLLTVPPGDSRLRVAFPPLLTGAAAAVFLTLSCPHELLARQVSLAGQLLLPAQYAAPAVRTLAQCLMMLALFLGTGSAVELFSEQVSAPLGGMPRFLPWAVLLLLSGSQLLPPEFVWPRLMQLLPLVSLPLGAAAILCPIISLLRRDRR